MLLNPGQVYTGLKRTVSVFTVLFFLFVGSAKAQNPKDPSSPDLPVLPNTQMSQPDLYNLLKDKKL